MLGFLSLGLVFPGSAVVKNPLDNVEDMDLIPGSGMFPGGGHGNPFRYSCLENWMEKPGGIQSMGSQRVEHD